MMQPIFNDLNGLEQRLNSWQFIQNKKQIIDEYRWKQHSTELRTMHVAVLALIVLAGSASACLIISGVVRPMQGGYAINSFIKMLTGGLIGVITYDLFRLQNIIDRCRAAFREGLYALKHNQITEQFRSNFSHRCINLKKEYQNLYIIDRFLDLLPVD